jgi:uncharacterized protein (TIGR03437 family)
LKLTAGNRPNVVTLYGTGFRHAAAESLKVTIDGQPARVLSAGAQGLMRGLDQVTIEIPARTNVTAQRQAEVAISINGVTFSKAMRLLR